MSWTIINESPPQDEYFAFLTTRRKVVYGYLTTYTVFVNDQEFDIVGVFDAYDDHIVDLSDCTHYFKLPALPNIT